MGLWNLLNFLLACYFLIDLKTFLLIRKVALCDMNDKQLFFKQPKLFNLTRYAKINVGLFCSDSTVQMKYLLEFKD